jgi:hypothetical protein
MKAPSFRPLVALAAAVLAFATPASRAQEEEKVLNVYNWSEYIAEDTLRNFEKETGIKVRYDNYDNNEILHAKLVAGKDRLRHRRAQRALREDADRGRPVPEAGPVAADELGQPRQGPAGPAGQGRPGQPAPGDLAVGLRHGRRQYRQGQGGAGRRPAAREPLGPDLQARVREQAQGLRHQPAGLGLRGDAGGHDPGREGALQQGRQGLRRRARCCSRSRGPS